MIEKTIRLRSVMRTPIALAALLAACVPSESASPEAVAETVSIFRTLSVEDQIAYQMLAERVAGGCPQVQVNMTALRAVREVLPETMAAETAASNEAERVIRIGDRSPGSAFGQFIERHGEPSGGSTCRIAQLEI